MTKNAKVCVRKGKTAPETPERVKLRTAYLLALLLPVFSGMLSYSAVPGSRPGSALDFSPARTLVSAAQHSSLDKPATLTGWEVVGIEETVEERSSTRKYFDNDAVPAGLLYTLSHGYNTHQSPSAVTAPTGLTSPPLALLGMLRI